MPISSGAQQRRVENIMKTALYAGSFDPITLGHLDIIKQAAQDFNELYVVLMENSSKTQKRVDERKEWLHKVINSLKFNHVYCSTIFFGKNILTVDVAKAFDASILIRGIRNVTNMEEELQLSFNNAILDPGIHTVWYPVSQQYAHVSSTAIRSILQCTKDCDYNSQNVVKGIRRRLSHYLPEVIIDDIIQNKELYFL